MDKNMSYIYGLFQTDGHLYEQSRNRGKLKLEINSRDIDILQALDEIIPCNSYISSRKRTTNFGKIETATLSICDLEFRSLFKSYGFPAGKKSDIIKPPINVDYSETDYVRGLIDGDGSLGITGTGIPFLSFITKSEEIKNYYINFLAKITGKLKINNRNKRDNAFNICIYREDAQKVIDILYYNNCLCIERKKNKAAEALKWKRPDDVKIINRNTWNLEQDEYIKQHSIEESTLFLKRTKKSIESRLYKLQVK